MYADREEVEAKRSIKDRLNGASVGDTRRRQLTGKRHRQDDKWEHDLYNDDESQISNHKVGARDLRLKLQRKNIQQASQSGPLSGVRDLREKLSGLTNTQLVNTDPSKAKLEAFRPPKKSVAVEAPATEAKKATNPASKKKAPQKAVTSVNEFLHSLDLEKYLITFQAEEVDMAALLHMTDDDLKALGIPMGPRKKILLALESRA
ncbi:ankyrin repeat and SAM domain-containing protein 6-like isoform X1 [Juglans microcarpa x Juglans regia]|uniref:ankyrin repeat and SAM domain-containing protein 6-like isoform X1 n=1 Tax=Juglans microcarpa x Juglans regia TaxID=2249226 RepID=UPI001B7DD7B9|nr:ankyrin repeat and SAM domain-containing protein 6-like isoform X1 [Juglans microcarpa x Juglans regia]XP_041008782.1 ankyrin repeat and SAM domain-containing protein 6-like isoform X1 [Juglans microcarpa x Juglans regia]XP_041008783.1 ankyrin repeat and SAM domain-containing protein 6-like isoform X1 [Juglans microcarpa x Juglans regia]